MSIFTKHKQAAWIDSDKETHPSHGKYRPYHHKIQKKQARFDQDWFSIEKDGKSLYVGVNKDLYHCDFKCWHDNQKDGN